MSEAAPTRRRTTKAEQRAEKMEQILDAAEELFSKHGLHGVTLKDVAKQVGVHHTLMNYYFDDKKALFDAVFARRAVVTSERRMRALDELLEDKAFLMRDSHPVGVDATAFAMLAAIMTPFFDSPLRRQAESYPRLTDYVGRMMTRFYPAHSWGLRQAA